MVNARSVWKLVTCDLDFNLETYFRIFLIKASSVILGMRYVFGIYGSPSSFKVMGLISRSRSQNGGSAQVCAPFGRSLMRFALTDLAKK